MRTCIGAAAHVTYVTHVMHRGLPHMCTQDPMADPGERALAQELRGIGLVAYEVPEWKTKVRVT